jgi:pimeloyl-ACP methyl ester carboxylesterase
VTKNLMRAVYTLALVGLQACMPYRTTDGPMKIIDDTLNCAVRPTTLVVLLPGAYDGPQDFKDYGFVTALRQRNIDADIQLVDAHIGYFTNQQIVQRLEDEIVLPAKTKGYKKIWFVGISLGGYGTLLYSMSKPTDVDGFFIMAPYMGPRDIPAEIRRQGGLKTWASDVQGNIDIDLWRWLQGYSTGRPNMPQAYIGYGASDRFEKPNQLLADVLPKERSFVIPGGHDWATWQRLWTNFLDVAPLPKLAVDQKNCKAS